MKPQPQNKAHTMPGPAPCTGAVAAFTGTALDQLMPMHLIVDPTGHISRAGPAIGKVIGQGDLVGRRFLEVFEIIRPHGGQRLFEDLLELSGKRLRLAPRTDGALRMKGVLLEAGEAGLLLNLSFGLCVVEAVKRYGLTNSDFAPTDLAIEMLYVVEAKTAVLEESRRLNQRLHAAQRAAREQAMTDTLTGLYNRRAMDETLARLLASQSAFALMHLDLDYFKAVNDTHGHAAGDQVLRVAADILREEVREGDTVARVGGDEFVLVFENLTDGEKLTAIAERIVERLEEPVQIGDETCRISGSIGFTTSDFYPAPDPDQMLSDADLALYASKHEGRARATMVTRELLDAASMAANSASGAFRGEAQSMAKR